MAIPHAAPGDVIEVRPLGAELASSRTQTLIKTPSLEVVRLVLPGGKTIAEHHARGEITVHCLEGRMIFGVSGERRELSAGELLYLEAGTPHSVEALEDCSFLLTLVLPAKA